MCVGRGEAVYLSNVSELCAAPSLTLVIIITHRLIKICGFLTMYVQKGHKL